MRPLFCLGPCRRRGSSLATLTLDPAPTCRAIALATAEGQDDKIQLAPALL